MEKDHDGCKKIYQKLSNIRDRETRPFPEKKFTPAFAATGNFFSKKSFGFRHWVTGIIKPNDGNIL